MVTHSDPASAQLGDTRFLRWRGAGMPGSPLVFLHGLGDAADIWDPVLKAWPTGPMAAVAPDLPGHGRSKWLAPDAYSLAAITEQVSQGLKASLIRKPVIIGHSLGARVALSLAAGGHIEAERVILIDVNPDPLESVGDAVSDYIDMLIEGAPTMFALIENICGRLPLADRSVLERVIPAFVAAGNDGKPSVPVSLGHDPEIKRLLNAPMEVDGWAQLAQLTCPVSILRGAFSSALDAPTLQKMSKSTSTPASTFTVPKSGHAIALEQPAALAKCLSDAVMGKRGSLR